MRHAAGAASPAVTECASFCRVALPIDLGQLQGGAIAVVIRFDEIGDWTDTCCSSGPSAKASFSGRPPKRPRSTSLSRFVSASKVRHPVDIARGRAHGHAMLEISAPGDNVIGVRTGLQAGFHQFTCDVDTEGPVTKR